MIARLAADAVVLLHLVFVLFVVVGGVAVLRWPRLAWLHVPAAIWGSLVELAGWICPLTPVENALRRAAGDAGYPGAFLERYLMPVLYPAELTRTVQVTLGLVVVAVNAAVYGVAIARWRSRRRRGPGSVLDRHPSSREGRRAE